MGEWVKTPAPTRQYRREKSYDRSWWRRGEIAAQRRRWFRLCLDHDAMREAVSGACAALYRAPLAFPTGRALLYKMARSRNAVYETDGLVGSLFATINICSSGHAVVIQSKNGPYVEFRDWEV